MSETTDPPMAKAEGAPASKPPGPPEPFLRLMRSGWAEPAEDQLSTRPHAPFHAARRATVSERFAGETLVVPTGGLKTRSNDTDYDFRPGTDFAYLTGHYEPDAVLVFSPTDDGHETTIYLRARAPRDTDDFFANQHGELWNGRRHTTDGYATLLGLSCKNLSELDGVIEKLNPATTRVRRGIDPRIDSAIEANAGDTELASFLAEMRMVKDSWEIAQLTDAIDATVRGFCDVVAALPADAVSTERLVDAEFGRRARLAGNYVGYGTIAAGGAHACTLHWIRNDGPVRPGELLLLDAGVENVHFYTADITRTMPVSGRFTPFQRQIYDIVYDAQQAGFAAVKPGASWQDVHLTCMRVLAAGLAELNILPTSVDEALTKESQVYRRWTLHNFGHMLGIDVHDCENARNDTYRGGTLRVGEVLTVEPGLYFQPDDLLVPEQYRGIGIRIEDDVVVTQEGCHVLSAALPSQADELEAWMARIRG